MKAFLTSVLVKNRIMKQWQVIEARFFRLCGIKVTISPLNRNNPDRIKIFVGMTQPENETGNALVFSLWFKIPSPNTLDIPADMMTNRKTLSVFGDKASIADVMMPNMVNSPIGNSIKPASFMVFFTVMFIEWGEILQFPSPSSNRTDCFPVYGFSL